MSPLQFHRTLEQVEVWSAISGGFSFAISYESPTGSGFHGRAGYVASWRPLYLNSLAIKVSGSPFETFGQAEDACNALLNELELTLEDLNGGSGPDDRLLPTPWPGKTALQPRRGGAG